MEEELIREKIVRNFRRVENPEDFLTFSFDEEGDILDIHIGKPKPAISREVEDDFFVRLDPKTEEVVGFTIINFTKWFKGSKGSKSLPIKAKFLLEKE